jgi:zinc protease
VKGTRTTPALSAPPSFQPPAVERAQLGNGLSLLIVSKRGLPIFDVQLLTSSGAVADATDRAGRASLAAEMIDEGTSQHSALELAAYVELLGVDMDVRAGWDASYLTLHGLSSRLDQILDLMREIALEPAFPPEEFQRKHEERLHALLQERDEPRTVAVKSLSRAIFGVDHPFGRPISGTVATVERLTLDDVLASYRASFVPANSHVLIVGDVGVEDAVAAIERRFGAWSAPGAAAPALPAQPEQRRSIHLIDRPGAGQSEVRVGHVGLPRRTPDYFAIVVMNTILGGSFKSRLNMKLREEKGFTYGASSAFGFRRQGGAFTGGAAVHTEATAETVQTYVVEMERMKLEPVPDEELVRARNYLSLGFMRNFETTGDILGNLSELAIHGLPDDYWRSYAERIAAVSAQDVQRAAEQYLRPDELSIVVVGDRARVYESLRDLQLGEVLLAEAE